MTYRVRNLVIAIGLALVAMMLTLFYVTNYKRSVQKDASSVQVYVAARDIQAGVSGADLVKQHALKVETIRRRADVNRKGLDQILASVPIVERPRAVEQRDRRIDRRRRAPVPGDPQPDAGKLDR